MLCILIKIIILFILIIFLMKRKRKPLKKQLIKNNYKLRYKPCELKYQRLKFV